MRRLLAVVCATIASLTGLLALAAGPAQASEQLVCVVFSFDGDLLGEVKQAIPPPLPVANETCVWGSPLDASCTINNIWVLENEHVFLAYCNPAI